MSVERHLSQIPAAPGPSPSPSPGAAEARIPALKGEFQVGSPSSWSFREAKWIQGECFTCGSGRVELKFGVPGRFDAHGARAWLLPAQTRRLTSESPRSQLAVNDHRQEVEDTDEDEDEDDVEGEGKDADSDEDEEDEDEGEDDEDEDEEDEVPVPLERTG